MLPGLAPRGGLSGSPGAVALLVAPLVPPAAPLGVRAAPPAPLHVQHPLHHTVVGLAPLGDHTVGDPPGVDYTGVGVGAPGLYLVVGEVLVVHGACAAGQVAGGRGASAGRGRGSG